MKGTISGDDDKAEKQSRLSLPLLCKVINTTGFVDINRVNLHSDAIMQQPSPQIANTRCYLLFGVSPTATSLTFLAKRTSTECNPHTLQGRQALLTQGSVS